MMSVVASALILCLSAFGPSSQEASKPATREKAEATILDALRLLEAKDYRQFLLEFMPPDMVKAKTKSPAEFDAWVRAFATHSVAFTLPRVREGSKVAPTYDQAKTTATFPLKQYDGTKWFKLIKIGRYWYVEPYQ